MSRIELADTGMDVLIKMSDGNPGAITAMMVMLKEAGEIDPDNILGGLGSVMLLDTWEIYGSSIYVLYNDKCDRDLRKMLVLMRATQLGKFPHTRLQELANDQTRSINLSDEEYQELDDFVCEKLEGFARP